MINHNILNYIQKISFISKNNIFSLSIYRTAGQEWCIDVRLIENNECINDFDFYPIEQISEAATKFNSYYKKYIKVKVK